MYTNWFWWVVVSFWVEILLDWLFLVSCAANQHKKTYKNVRKGSGDCGYLVAMMCLCCFKGFDLDFLLLSRCMKMSGFLKNVFSYFLYGLLLWKAKLSKVFIKTVQNKIENIRHGLSNNSFYFILKKMLKN